MRKTYELTQKQLEKINKRNFVMPKDDEIKAEAKKSRKPWGLVKLGYTLEALKWDPDYIRGMFQARVDRMNGLDYSEERNDSSYNLGYYRGYTDYDQFSRSEGFAILAADYQN
jgi:hypothetical protein